MADVNKSIQINVEADLKHLLNNLQKMPNMTKKEAQKMVKTLSTELKKAEMAAKEAAKATQTSFKNIDNSAKSAAQSTRQFKKQTRELGGAVQATGDLIGEFDPALGGAVVTIQMAGMAVRDLGKAFLTGNPYILAAVAAIAAGVAVYSVFAAETQALETQQNNLQGAITAADSAIQMQIEAALNAATALQGARQSVEDLQFEYDLLTGKVNKFDADMRKANKASQKFQAQLVKESGDLAVANLRAIKAQEQKIKEIKNTIALEAKLGKHQRENGKQNDLAILRQNQLSSATEKLNQMRADAAKQEEEFTNQIADQAFEFENLQQDIAKTREEQRKQREEEKALQDAARNRAQRLANQQREAAKARAEELKEEARLMAITGKLEQMQITESQSALSIENQNRAARIALIDDEIKRKEAQLQLDTDITNQTITGLEAQKQANLDLAQSEEQIAIAKATNLELDQQILGLREGLQIKEEALSKMRQKNLEEEGEKAKLTGDQIAGFYIQSAKAASELIKMVGGENKKAALIAFRVSQAAAVAEIAINTAKKVMEVAPNPFAMGAIGALGALQAATVLATPPPEFHMGGMIGKGDDTKQITALSGEAVIDRQTVQRLGGEKGVNALQRGNMSPSNQVIVIQPYKHFDRFVRTNQKRGGIMSKLNKVSAAGSY